MTPPTPLFFLHQKIKKNRRDKIQRHKYVCPFRLNWIILDYNFKNYQSCETYPYNTISLDYFDGAVDHVRPIIMSSGKHCSTKKQYHQKSRMVFFSEFCEVKSVVLDKSFKSTCKSIQGNSDKVFINELLQTTVNEIGWALLPTLQGHNML